MNPKSFGLRQTGKPSSGAEDGFGSHSQGPVGLLAGTLVWTSDGTLPVEYLVAGDRVVTRDGGLVALDAVAGHTALTRLVRLPPHTFGPGRPGRALDLPAAQPVLVRGEPAERLCGAGAGFVAVQTLLDWNLGEDLGRRSVHLFTPIFDRPRILYCSGVEIGFPNTET